MPQSCCCRMLAHASPLIVAAGDAQSALSLWPAFSPGIGLADVVAEKQEPAAVPLNSGSVSQLEKRLAALEEQATSTLRDQVRLTMGLLMMAALWRPPPVSNYFVQRVGAWCGTCCPTAKGIRSHGLATAFGKLPKWQMQASMRTALLSIVVACR